MKIEKNVIYHLPTQAHEDDFLKQAEKQRHKWANRMEPNSEKHWNGERYCICLGERGLQYASQSFFEGESPKLSVFEWKKKFSKEDMQEGQMYRQADGNTYQWKKDEYNYNDDLTYTNDQRRYPDYDIVEVYPMKMTPIWKREEPKYRVKTELTKEQAEKLGLEFCEEVKE